LIIAAVAANPPRHRFVADLLGLRAVRVDLLGAKVNAGVWAAKLGRHDSAH
jgi:hypothetical protein